MLENKCSVASHDLTNFVRRIERELHDINEYRVEKLEVVILEKERAIQDIIEKLEALKGDFEYNVSLLEARDTEIIRMETNNEALSSRLEAKSEETTYLRRKLRQLESKIAASDSMHTRSEMETQGVIFEITKEVNGIKLATKEEMESKQKEIESLRTELRKVLFSHKRAMEHQRENLMFVFEAMIKDREERYTSQVEQISQGISSLNNDLHLLQTENVRLKSELMTSRGEIELLKEEGIQREGYVRQTQQRFYEINEEREKDKGLLEAQQQDATKEISTMKAKFQIQSNDYKRNLQELEIEIKNEKRRCAVYEKMLEDSKDQHQSDVSNFALRIDEGIEKNEILLREMDSLLNSYHQICKQEKNLSTQYETKQEELSTMRRTLESLHDEIMQKDKLIKDAEKLYDATKAEYTKAVEFIYSTHKRELKILKEKLSPSENDDKRQLCGKCLGLKEKIVMLISEQDELNNACILAKKRIQKLETDLLNEQAEKSALKLRVTAELRSIQCAQDDSASGFSTSAAVTGDKSSYGVTTTKYKGFEEPQSPQFSDDLGPASLPTSPTSFMSPNRLDLGKFIGENEVLRGEKELYANNNNLINENERLRNTIKIMRADLEVLRNQSSTTTADSTKISSLETRVEMSNQEISKLTKEKRKLMDIGNEMRSRLNELRIHQSVPMSIKTSLVTGSAPFKFIKDDTHDIGGKSEIGDYKSSKKSENTPVDPMLLVPVTSLDPRVHGNVEHLQARQMKIDRRPNYISKQNLLSMSYPSQSRENLKNGSGEINNFHVKDVPVALKRKVMNYNELRAKFENL